MTRAKGTIIQRKIFSKKIVTTENNWTFQLGVESGIIVPIYGKVSFQKKIRSDI